MPDAWSHLERINHEQFNTIVTQAVTSVLGKATLSRFTVEEDFNECTQCGSVIVDERCVVKC